MMSENDKNGLLDEEHRWPDAIVPYDIEEDDFCKSNILLQLFNTLHPLK